MGSLHSTPQILEPLRIRPSESYPRLQLLHPHQIESKVQAAIMKQYQNVPRPNQPTTTFKGRDKRNFQYPEIVLPRVGSYEKQWHLQYKTSPDLDPFPENMATVVSKLMKKPLSFDQMIRKSAALAIKLMDFLRSERHDDESVIIEQLPLMPVVQDAYENIPRGSTETTNPVLDQVKMLAWAFMYYSDMPKEDLTPDAVAFANNVLSATFAENGAQAHDQLTTLLWILLGHCILSSVAIRMGQEKQLYRTPHYNTPTWHP
jgi:hypothetical protein